jgi:hypothetical protein
VVDYAKRAKKNCLILKVDFEKAYDSVNWKFLEYMLRRFGFTNKWIGWVKACVCSGCLSVLVNGSPSREVNIARGLKQGDPLAPFLFLLVVEGFGLLMSKAVSMGFFKPFVIKKTEVAVSHLQYADDTLIVGEASVENLWCVKAILRWFQLMSGLKVNFFKSRLLGVNVDEPFLRVASRFLNCKLGKFPFIYLGLPVGANPRKEATWNPVVEVIQKRLNSWRNRFVSIGGRVILINSVLAAIPVFYLSFLKMPTKVWKMIVAIQRYFLWGGSCNNSKIAWVKWSDLCRAKAEGGLGIKNLRLVNVSLLLKWRWRLLVSQEALWSLVLKAKYGADIGFSSDLLGCGNKRFASFWWKDLCNLGQTNVHSNDDWCSEVMVKKVGNGGGTRFWLDKWVGGETLALLFPRLYSISNQKDFLISNMGGWSIDGWVWNLSWRRNLFLWEEELCTNLLNVIGSVILTSQVDVWNCEIGRDGIYSVKEGYDFLCQNFLPQININNDCRRVLKESWNSFAPLKVVIFSWKLVLNRLPTRRNLVVRGLLDSGASPACVWCPLVEENESHLFFSCPLAVEVWTMVMAWLGLVTAVPGNAFHSFESFGVPFRTNTRIKGLILIWQTVVWSIWLARNALIFEGVKKEGHEIVDAIKHRSLQWFIARKQGVVCLAYEWEKLPLVCLNR